MRRMLSPVSLRQLGQTESMADEDEFKKNQKIMAAKRTRKTERNKLGKGKDWLVPEKLTIQRLSGLYCWFQHEGV
jgi:hypothetical protein